MTNSQRYVLCGFIHPLLDIRASFITPLFGDNKYTYLQSAYNDTIEEFIPYSVPPTVPRIRRPQEDYYRAIGDPALHAFFVSHSELIVGNRSEVSEIITRNLDRISDDPFLLIELSRFIGDSTRLLAAIEQAEEILGKTNRAIARRWRLAAAESGPSGSVRHVRLTSASVPASTTPTQMNSPADAKVTSKQEATAPGGQNQRPLKRAICLGGGGPAAGLHIGVLEGLEANRIKFTPESDIWALSCIGAWVGVLYNQAKQNREIEETYNFFRGIFRDNKSFQSFPMNTVFAPDWAGNAEAMLDYLLEPRNYKNAFLPKEIMKSFMHTMSALRGMATSRRMQFSEGDFNRWVLNDVLAVNPVVRLWMGMVFKSEITGLARLYYPDSKFLRDIKFDQLEHHNKPYIFHNAWNLSKQDIQLFSNRDPAPPSHNRYKRITPQSLCACSALPLVEETVEIDGDIYCEGALKDTVNFKDLLKDHHHPPHDPLDEIWISRIVDADQVRAPKDLQDALANLCQLFAATVGEDDVKLFLWHVREHQGDPRTALRHDCRHPDKQPYHVRVVTQES